MIITVRGVDTEGVHRALVTVGAQGADLVHVLILEPFKTQTW